MGYRTTTFESAEDFLKSSTVADTACLITDLQMPGLNGLELQEALQSLGNQTPVIVITAYPNEKDRTRALENGAVGYLSKPFDEQTLIECADGCDQIAIIPGVAAAHSCKQCPRRGGGAQLQSMNVLFT